MGAARVAEQTHLCIRCPAGYDRIIHTGSVDAQCKWAEVMMPSGCAMQCRGGVCSEDGHSKMPTSRRASALLLKSRRIDVSCSGSRLRQSRMLERGSFSDVQACHSLGLSAMSSASWRRTGCTSGKHTVPAVESGLLPSLSNDSIRARSANVRTCATATVCKRPGQATYNLCKAF